MIQKIYTADQYTFYI